MKPIDEWCTGDSKLIEWENFIDLSLTWSLGSYSMGSYFHPSDQIASNEYRTVGEVNQLPGRTNYFLSLFQ